jgi:hypothetical protein
MRGVRAAALSIGLVALSLWASGCGRHSTGERAFGEPLEVAQALRLADVLDGLQPSDDGVQVVVRGTIGEVCRSSGCWFVLHDVVDGKAHELFVDLQQGADFTIPQGLGGRPAVVRGRIVGRPPDLELHADGLVVE